MKLDYFLIITIYIFLAVILPCLFIFFIVKPDPEDMFVEGFLSGIWFSVFTWWFFVKIPADGRRSQKEDFEN